MLDGKTAWFGISKNKIHAPEEKVETLDLTTKFDRFDFVGTRKKFYVISAVLLISGAIALGIFKLNLGIDFSSGTRVEVLAERPLTKDEISTYLDEIGHPTNDIVISGDTGNIGVMRYKDEF